MTAVASEPAVVGLRQRRWAALLLIAILFAAQMAVRFNSDLNHDTAWYLYIAQGLLDGKELYKDFVEVNPPLAIWLTVPVPWIGRLAGLDPVTVFYLLVFLVTALTLLAVGRYAGLVAAVSAGGRELLPVLAAAILLFAPGGNFGQREQVIVLFILPWLMLRAARADGASLHPLEAAVVGIVAAMGICLKPHSVLVPVCVEIVLLLRHRRWRLLFAAENLAGAAFAVAYVAIVVVLVPAYFSTMVGLGIKAYVPFYGGDANWVITGSLPTVASLLIAAVTIALVDAGVRRTLPAALLAAAAGFLASYFVQAKGYSYQLLPAQAFACLTAAAALATIAAASRGPLLAKLLAALLTGIVFTLNYRPQIYPYPGTPFERMIDQYRPASRSVFIATTNVYKSFPLVLKRNLVWASRFPAQWLAPYVASKWRVGPLPDDAIVTYALDAAVGDLARFRPDIVIVDVSDEQAYVPGGHFGYLKFWAMDARFAAIWRDYEPRGTQDGYEIYTRKDGL